MQRLFLLAPQHPRNPIISKKVPEMKKSRIQIEHYVIQTFNPKLQSDIFLFHFKKKLRTEIQEIIFKVLYIPLTPFA